VRTSLEKPEVMTALTALIEAKTKPLVSKRDELLASLSERNEVIKSFGGVEAIKALKDQADSARKAADDASAKSGDVEAIKRTYGDQMAKLSKELDDMKEAAKSEKVSSTITKAIREAQGVPEFLEPHVKSRVRSDLVDGVVKLTVIGLNGAPMLTADGKDATVKDLLAEFKNNAVFARAFDAPSSSGSGSKANASAGGGQANPWNPATFNFSEQNRIARSDPTLATTMAAQYGKKLAF
jgi:alanyl-tRNA synthetase